MELTITQPDWIEYAVIAGYFIMLLGVGFFVKKLNADESDYFRNGCRGTWWLVGASAFMVSFSAWTFTGAAGIAFKSGWSMLWIYLANAIGFFLNFLFLAPWFRQLRATTGPEIIGWRFGPGTKQFNAWFHVVMRLLYSGVHLYGLAIFSATVFGLSVQFTIVVVGVVVLVYAMSGGSWAVMATDFLQSMILVPLTVLICVLCLRHIGGVGGMLEAISAQGLTEDFRMVNAPGHFPKNAYTWFWVIAMIGKNMISHNTLSAAPRYFSVKDGRDARKAALLACLLTLAGTFVWAIPPLVARLTMHDQVMALSMAKPTEAAYAMVSLALLPNGMIGLMVVAIFAATMSSMDTGLNRNAAIVTRDIYPALCRLFGKAPNDTKSRLWLARGLTCVFGASTIFMALYFSAQEGRGVFEVALSIGALLGLPLTIPLLLGLFVRRVPGWAAMFSTIVALVPSVLGYHSKALFGAEWNFQQQVFINTAVGTAAFLLTGFFWKKTKPDYRQKVDTFFETMHTPVDFEKEVGGANDTFQLRMMGQFGMAAALFIALLLLIPNTGSARVSIAFVAIFIGLVSTLLLMAGYRKPKSREGVHD